MKHPCGLPEIDRMIAREQEFRDEMPRPEKLDHDPYFNPPLPAGTHSPQPSEQEAAPRETVEGLFRAAGLDGGGEISASRAAILVTAISRQWSQSSAAAEAKLATAETNADEWMERWVQASGEVKRVKAKLARVEKALMRYGTHDNEFDGKGERECREWRDGPDTCDCGLAAALKGEGE